MKDKKYAEMPQKQSMNPDKRKGPKKMKFEKTINTKREGL
jgi:hypothetical protein